MTKKFLLPKTLFCALAVAGATTSSQATLLVQESFNYGGSAISNMNGVAETGTGLQGNWTVTNALPSGGLASSAYQTTGLTFGSNYGTTSGGALLSTTRFSGSNAATTATVQLDVNATGEVWGSYLVSYNTISSSNGGFAQEGIATSAAGTTINLTSMMQSNTLATDRKLQVGYDSSVTSSISNTAFLTGTTYIYISKYTNVGTAPTVGTPGVATTWVMTQAQYDLWVTGGATELTLTANSLVTRTETVTSGSAILFDNTGFVTLKTDAPNTNNAQVVAIFDEVRYGTTLSDVYSAVPEPSATALLFGAGVSVLLFRRKRTI